MEEKECRFLRLTSFTDERGKLAAIEGGDTVPFEIRRVFFLYDLNPTAVRGNHAAADEECIFIISGSCRVRTHDGEKETFFLLDSPMCGVYVPAMIWREISDCSKDCVLAVLSDQHYDPEDCVRDFGQFLRLRAEQRKKNAEETING